MQSHHATGCYRFEQLEQRRMLSGAVEESSGALTDESDGVRAPGHAATLMAGTAAPSSVGRQVPFHGTLAGSFTTSPIPGTPNALIVAGGAGEATQLGHFSFDFPLTVNLALQTGSGRYTFTAADGGAVYADVAAQSRLLPNGLRQVVETATITGGTGRFAGATGSYTSERFLDRATGAVTGSFEGTISAPGPSRATSQDEAGSVVPSFAGDAQGVKVVWGEQAVVDGARLATWALVSGRENQVLAVGATMALKFFEEQPEDDGPGPAGAWASLDFPQVVQGQTYFNHFELQSEPHGHPTGPGSVNPDRNRVPHFDFHFYAIPEEQVWQIPARTPPLPPVPADRLPAGYTQPGPSELQMGRHSAPIWSLSDSGFLSTIMITGFTPNASRMHFLEPMVSREFLMSKQDFTLPVPMPQTFDRDTLYPTSFEGLFHGGAYHFVFSNFVDTNPATPAVTATPPGVGISAPAATFPEHIPAQPEWLGLAGVPDGQLADDDQSGTAREILR